MTIDDIVISGDNFEVTDAMKELIHKKFSRLLNHYGHFITDIEIILKISDHHNIAEANMNVPEKHITAKASTEDMYKSFDEMIQKAKVQLEKYKEIHLGHKQEEKSAQQFEEHLTLEEADRLANE